MSSSPSPAPPVSDALLDAYADLLVRVGVALRPGRRLTLRAPLEAAPLARRVARHAYRAGSPFVDVHYHDEAMARIRYREAPEGTFEILPTGRAEAFRAMAERGDAFLTLHGSDPGALADVDPERVATARAANARAMQTFQAFVMRDAVPWTVAAAPIPAWAEKVFPDAEPEAALAALWRAVLQAARADVADPEAAWRQHADALEARARHLEARRFAALHFTGPGTDLTVGLAEGHAWAGGSSRTPDGTRFVANLPTEEVFTAPHAERVDGRVRAAKPLVRDGRIIDGFDLTFRDGRVVDARADSGGDVLQRLLDTDAGARRLGEVALVEAGGPIDAAGHLFLDTLFDENAASHLALGRAYAFCLQGGEELDDEARAARGANDSLVHADFMIGRDDMDVDGLAEDGRAEPVMRSGRFVI